jgi:hypothetical protein|tara:strand:- start:1025 stop:1201 length:177 start_codon:yes stop_codon:yes gene_type:complete
MNNMIDNPTEELKDMRIKGAEKACRNATTDWGKDFWYNVFSILCKKYDRMDYFRKVIN